MTVVEVPEEVVDGLEIADEFGEQVPGRCTSRLDEIPIDDQAKFERVHDRHAA